MRLAPGHAAFRMVTQRYQPSGSASGQDLVSCGSPSFGSPWPDNGGPLVAQARSRRVAPDVPLIRRQMNAGQLPAARLVPRAGWGRVSINSAEPLTAPHGRLVPPVRKGSMEIGPRTPTEGFPI